MCTRLHISDGLIDMYYKLQKIVNIRANTILLWLCLVDDRQTIRPYTINDSHLATFLKAEPYLFQ